MANIGDYATTYELFDWETPERFNFGRDVVDKWPEDRPAMVWLGTSGEERRLTFGDFSRLSNRFANVARDMGVSRGDRVMVLLGKVPEWHAILTGLLKLGAIAIPCAPQLRAGDLKFRAEHSGSVAMISGPEGIGEVEKMRSDAPDLDTSSLWARRTKAGSPSKTLMDGASEDFTAEDTAADGGRVHPLHLGDDQASQRRSAHPRLHPRQVDAGQVLAGSPGGRQALVHLGDGMGQEHLERFPGTVEPGDGDLLPRGRLRPCRTPGPDRSATTSRSSARPRPSTASSPRPPNWNAQTSPPSATPSLPGEPLNPPVIERWKELHGVTIYDGYGQTENTLLVGNFPGLDVRPGSMGKPSPGCDVKVIDPEGNECQPDEPGDIALCGRIPALFKEYWEQPDETEAVFRDGYYLTGDRAYRDEDGYLWFVGRSDDVILSAGYRIGPFEVESILIEHPAVVESAVVPLPDEDRGKRRQGVRSRRQGLRTVGWARAGDTGLLQGEDGPVQVSAQHRVHRRATQDHERQDPARRAASTRDGIRLQVSAVRRKPFAA